MVRKARESTRTPYAGHFTVRVAPELHRRVATATAPAGKNVNGFIAETLACIAAW